MNEDETEIVVGQTWRRSGWSRTAQVLGVTTRHVWFKGSGDEHPLSWLKSTFLDRYELQQFEEGKTYKNASGISTDKWTVAKVIGEEAIAYTSYGNGRPAMTGVLRKRGDYVDVEA